MAMGHYPVPLWQVHVREHGPEDGCYGCCDDCNYDTHRCGGCGTPIAHKEPMCDECKELYKDVSK